MASRQHDTITLRVPRALTAEVRQLADRDGEAQAVTYRRLLKFGLKAEQDRSDVQLHDERRASS